MPANFPSSPIVGQTYLFGDQVFVFDGTKWKQSVDLMYVSNSIQYIKSGNQASRPTANAASLYYNTDLQGLEFYYPEVSTWEVINTFARQVDATSGNGQVAYTAPGTYTFVCPLNVYQVHVVCVGGGGGGSTNYGASTSAGSSGSGGGGLAWRNNISVTPGQSYTVVVGAGGIGGAVLNTYTVGTTGGTSYFKDLNTVAAYGGTGSPAFNVAGSGGGFYTLIGPGGGGFGGNGGVRTLTDYAGGGGGAGGYTGNGGDGGANSFAGAAGTGGGGGGGGGTNAVGFAAGSGGGVGILGAGANGTGGAAGAPAARGGGGSGGVGTGTNQPGGAYGGGACGTDAGYQNGGNGAVRIIWGSTRAFPSTNTGDM